MPDNRLTLTIEAQNLAQAAFRQLQADVRQSNEALKRTDQTARQSSGGIKVIRDELGRFHDVATGRYVSAARLVREGFTEVGQTATRAVGPVRQLGKEAPGLERLYRAGQEIGDAFIRMPGPIGRTSQAIQRAGGSVARLTDQFIGLYRSSGAVRQLGREFRFLQTNIQATSGVSQQFTRHLTAGTKAIVQEAANLERLRLGLVAVTGSIQEADIQYRSFLETARTPGVFFRGVFEESLQLQALGTSAEFAERAVRSVGNAIALVGGNEAIFQRALYGLRQIIIDQRVLQRELNIFTQRIPQSIPFLRERYGGARAEDIRETLDAEGVRRTDQSNEFVRELIEFLETLPSASDTAANALENLGDTTRRLQANIGEGLLPAVKEAVIGVENLFLSVENNQSFKTAAADSLAFATAMGTVTAGVLGVAAVIPLLGGLANPIGLTALAAGALAGAFVKAEVAAARFRAEYDRTQDALQSGIRAGRGTDTSAIGKEIERLEARRKTLQAQIRREEEAAQAEEDAQPARRRGEPNPFRRTAEQILETNQAYKTYQDQLFQVDKTIEVLTRRQDNLSESAEKAAKTVVDTVSQAFQSLTAVASGTDAQIAEALQRFETATENADEQVRDLALDIGNQLVAIAEATSVAQIDASKRRVDALARDNSLILEGSKQLQALLLAGEEAFAARRRELRQDEFRLEVHDEEAQAQTEALLRFYDLQSTIQEDARLDAQRSAEAQATAYIKAYRDSIDPAVLNLVESVKLLRTEVRGNIQDLEALQRQDAFRIELRGEIGGEQRDALAELFDLQQAVQDGIRENEISNLRERSLALREKLSDDTLSLQRYKADVISILRAIYDAEVSFQAVDVRETQNQRQAENARKLTQTIIALEDAASETQIESVIRTAQERQRVLDGSVGALKVIYDRFVQLEQDAQRKLAALISGGEVAQARKELARLEERALDASSQRQRENVIRDTAQFVAAYAERGAAFRDFVTDAQSLGAELQEAFDLTEQAKRIEDFRDSVAGVIEDLAGITISHFWDSFTDGASTATDAVSDFTTRAGDAIRILESDILRLQRFNEDSDLRGERLVEDRERRIAQLRRQQQALAARAPTGNQRDIERNIQQRQDIAFRIRELREDFGVRISRQTEDAERRRSRLIEDAITRRERFEARGSDDSLIEKLVNSLAGTLSSALSSAIAGAIAGALTGQLSSLLDAIKGFFGGGDGDTDTGTGDGTGTGDADVDGMIKTLTVDPELATPSVDVAGVIKSAMQAAADAYTIPTIDVTGQITSAKLSEGATLPSVALTGTITASLAKAFTEPVPITGVINATLNAPQSIDLSGVPVTLPQAAVEVTKPASVDLSQVPVTGIPAQAVEVTTPTGVDLSGVPVTGIPPQAVEVTTPESIDLSNVPVVSIPTQKVMVDTPSSVDLSQVPVVSIPTQQVKVDTPSSVDLSNVPVTNISAQSIKVTAPQSVDLSGVPITLPQAALEIATPEKFDLSAVPVTLPRAALEVYTPTGFDLSGVPVTLPPATLDVGLNLPDPELLPPIDLGGLRLTNIPTVNIPFTLVPGDGTGETPEDPTPASNPDPSDPPNPPIPPPGNTIADVIANEGRRDKVFGSGNPTVQTDITSEELTQAVREGNQQAAERSGLHNLPRALAEGFQRIAGAIISSGAIGVGTGGGGGDGLDTGQDARDLGRDLDGSFRSDVIPTLLGNQPGTVQPGDRDPDDDTAQAPAAVRATADAINTIANVLSVDALAAVAQETTLSSIAGTLEGIRIATERTADAPLVDRLIEAGIVFPQTPEERTNSALPDFLTQQGLGLFADQDRLNSFLADMGPTPDLTAGIGGEGNPLFAKVEFPDVQKVEVVSGKVDANVTNEVNVKQVGTVQVTQAGEWVMRLASGATIPVYVQGGHVTADIVGGLEGLAIQLADTEVGLINEGII